MKCKIKRVNIRTDQHPLKPSKLIRVHIIDITCGRGKHAESKVVKEGRSAANLAWHGAKPKGKGVGSSAYEQVTEPYIRDIMKASRVILMPKEPDVIPFWEKMGFRCTTKSCKTMAKSLKKKESDSHA